MTERHGLTLRHPALCRPGDPRRPQSVVTMVGQPGPVERPAQPYGRIPGHLAKAIALGLCHEPLQDRAESCIDGLRKPIQAFHDFRRVLNDAEIQADRPQGQGALPEPASLVEPEVKHAKHPVTPLSLEMGLCLPDVLVAPNRLLLGLLLAHAEPSQGIVGDVAPGLGLAQDHREKLQLGNGRVARGRLQSPSQILRPVLPPDLAGRAQITSLKKPAHIAPQSLVSVRRRGRPPFILGEDPRQNPLPQKLALGRSPRRFNLALPPRQKLGLPAVASVRPHEPRRLPLPLPIPGFVSNPDLGRPLLLVKRCHGNTR